MTNLIVLDVVIGLVFVYLLYSMLATILQELLATWFSFRSKLLERAISRMLEDGSVFDKRFGSLKALFKKINPSENATNITGLFYNHPMVKYLAEDDYNSKPSYITKETFSKVMIDLLHGENVKPGEDIRPYIEKSINDGKTALSNIPFDDQTLRFIRSVWIDAQGDIDVFRKSLEQWFDDTMERCTGWYKKHTQYILLVLGLCIAIVFNVNTIDIIGKLEKDPALRESVVQQANAFTTAHPNLYQERENSLIDNNKKYSTPLLVSKTDTIAKKDSLIRQIIHTKSDSLARVNSDSLINRGKVLTQRADSLIQGDITKANGLLGIGIGSYSLKCGEWGKLLLSILGWLITALALSLGAPFWFDLLNKLMKLRSSASISTSTQSKGKEEDVKSTPVIRKG